MNWTSTLAKESAIRYYSRKYPVSFASAFGTTLTDTTGKDYIDMISGVGVVSVGHNHPRIKEKLIKFLEDHGPWSMLDLVTPYRTELVEKLMAVMPENIQNNGKIFFAAPTGADCVECAIKIARMNGGSERRSIIAFQGAYHGVTHGTLGLTGDASLKSRFEVLPYVDHIPFPYPAKSNLSEESILDLLSSKLNNSVAGLNGKPSLIIMEPIQGEGGVIKPSASFLQGVRSLATEHNVPLMFDEIQTGFGRTGKYFGHQHAEGVQPDIMTMAKALGGGLPISAIAYDNNVIDESKIVPGMHKGTFRGAQMSFAAASTVLDIIKDENLVSEAERKGKIVEAKLSALMAKHDHIVDVRGAGLMWSVELCDPSKPLENPQGFSKYGPNGKLSLEIQSKCFENGIMLENCGRDSSSLRILPPLTIEDSELEKALDIFSNTVETAIASQ